MKQIVNKDIKRYTEFCTGCGLCHSVDGVSFKKDERGFNQPKLHEENIGFCKKVCPASGRGSVLMHGDAPWGHFERVSVGWSASPSIRKQASSGGVLTSLCLYLLKEHLVDGIIQTRAATDCAYMTETVISRTEEEVLSCMGSRYAISSPLYNINQLISKNEVYAFVGKPCDVSALRMYMKEYEISQIKYLFSFFCAGEPSDNAQINLLKALGCENISDCKSLRYRGNGWPGLTVVETNQGESKTMLYDDSWGKILGRDIRNMCRFCFDGIGEMADIACGDAWHLAADGNPDFTESEGRNVIFARTKTGAELLEGAEKSGHITIQPYDIQELNQIQKSQFVRRATMGAKILGLNVFGRITPCYHISTLCATSRQLGIKTQVRTFFGTIKRIIRHRI